MTKPSTITQWLQNPASFSEEDRKAAAALLKTYPYFVPGRYLEAAEQHKKQPFAPSTLSMMLLYMGNRIQFHEFMEATGAQPTIPYEEDNDEDMALEHPRPAFTQEVREEALVEEFEVMEDEEEEEDLSEFGSWDDEVEDYSDMEDVETVPPPQPEPAKPSKPLFTRKQEPKPAPPPPRAAPEKRAPQPGPVAQQKPAPEKTKEAEQEKPVEAKPVKPVKKAEPLIQPIYTEEYFLHQGIQVSDFAPSPDVTDRNREDKGEKSLMVVMSFAEWLHHFKTKGQKVKEEVEDQKALKTMWQKEKLAAALEEENEEIPESVFEMAVNSITKEDDLASESLAEIMVKQGKYDKAIDMYRKLSLRNPQKSTYFARKIDRIIKENES